MVILSEDEIEKYKSYHIIDMEDKLRPDTYIRLLTAEKNLVEQDIPSIAFYVAQQRHVRGIGLRKQSENISTTERDLKDLCDVCEIPNMSRDEFKTFSIKSTGE